MRLLPNDKNRFKPRSGWSSANPWATAVLACWPPLTQAPTALCRDGGSSRLLNGLSWPLTQSSYITLSCRHSGPQTEPITREQLLKNSPALSAPHPGTTWVDTRFRHHTARPPLSLGHISAYSPPSASAHAPRPAMPSPDNVRFSFLGGGAGALFF